MGHRARSRGGRPLRDRYPVFFAFDRDPVVYLSKEEAMATTPQERIKSVWPFLVKVVLRFAETLRPRERANFDPEDLLTELYVVLMERDAKWEPARGKYLTFVARVVGNELFKIRDRTRTVRSPGNSYCRLKQYEAEEAAETISAQRQSTLAAMRRVMADPETLDASEPIAHEEEEMPTEAERDEMEALTADAVVEGLRALTGEEAMAISAAYGLWGQEERPTGRLARDRGLTHGSVKAAQARARSKMRARLRDIGHPSAPEPEPGPLTPTPEREVA